MRRNGEIAEWHDRNISAGTEWKESIDQNLENADIILLLVSADFLASDYCYENEMKRAMKLHQEGSTRVIPIILRACDWSSAPFAKLQALPKDAKPLKGWSDPDQGYHNVVMGIREAAARLEDSRPIVSLDHKHKAAAILTAGKLFLIGLCLLLIVGLVFSWFKLQSQNASKTNSQNGEAHTSGAQSDTVSQRPETILVTGFVFDSAGKGIDNAQVKVENMTNIDPVSTSSNGKFMITDVPGKPGDFIWLVFSKEGYKQERYEFQLNGVQKTVTLKKP